MVTGGLGLIGSHFAEQLVNAGAHVILPYRRDNRRVLRQLSGGNLRPVQADLRDDRDLERLFTDPAAPVDAIIHCAVVSGTMSVRLNQPAHILDANLRTVGNVLESARRHDVPDVVLLSSSDIYLDPGSDPIREDDDFRKGMGWSIDGYYLSKNFAEMMAEAYRAEYGINVFLPRLTSVYGPRDNFEPDTDRVVPTMVRKVLAGQDIEIWGDGSQTRTYMYAADLVRATLAMVEANKYPTLNIGTTETVSVLQLARMICAALEVPERIRIDLSKSGGRPSRNLDITGLGEIIDFTPRSLEQGLKETVAWYRDVYQTL
ncbi:NAD-dependent epimerase/dehydratase family protein [Micromonospora arborensis]|uniref:NAD-dependent epimerase/dehydratase family protein n=1 Tax=Micromonospora arborensis TaxID=2116518 RepID=UPI00142DB564|nr:NAD-dependent epimerase/dehydratase family protein [Micromonospora arborensis]